MPALIARVLPILILGILIWIAWSQGQKLFRKGHGMRSRPKFSKASRTKIVFIIIIGVTMLIVILGTIISYSD